MTTDARRALLHDLVDDAGLFPPARLAMNDALEAHRAVRASAESWMVGRFLCPTSRVEELLELRGGATEPSRLGLVVDEPPHGAVAALLHSGGMHVETVEARAPAGGWSTEAIDDLLGTVELLPDRPDVFLEVPDSTDAEVCLLHVGLVAAARAAEGGHVGAKLRCGGESPDAFPEPETVGTFIAAAAMAGVPFKATAGLHHPVRHRDDALGVWQHGFLNLLAAAAIALDSPPDEQHLTEVLREDDPTAFVVAHDRFGWREHTVDVATVARVRGQALTAYGSCSTAEPIEDLRALGVLPLPDAA